MRRGGAVWWAARSRMVAALALLLAGVLGLPVVPGAQSPGTTEPGRSRFLQSFPSLTSGICPIPIPIGPP